MSACSDAQPNEYADAQGRSAPRPSPIAAAVSRWAVERGGEHAITAYGAATLTWAELDSWSSTLAAQLADVAEQGEEPVLVMAGHDQDAVVALAAASKAGRPVAFIDTTTPVARITELVTLATPVATFVATAHRELAAAVEATGAGLGTLIPLARSGRREFAARALEHDAAVAIAFTSGSTGVPKGVVVGGESLAVELVSGPINTDVSARDRIGSINPLSFFLGFYNVVENLLRGWPSYLFDLRKEGVDAMVRWLDDSRITVLEATPHALRSVAARAAERGRVFQELRRVIIGGEAPQWRDAELLRECCGPDCELVNLSGASEAWAMTWYAVKVSTSTGVGAMPAGRPFPEKELLLVDERGEPVTPGVAGEIIALGRRSTGYWRNPEMTAKRFGVHTDGRLLYRTGDLARVRPQDGLIEYVGRQDHMVKIRGYLVEPAEVERHLMAKSEVRECVVVGSPGRVAGVSQLVAYVVPDPKRWVSGAALRRRLRDELPSYMVPQVVMELTVLPRNPNGKINRLQLPEPTRESTEPDRHDWSTLQLCVAGICERALGVDNIGLRESLLELGADSLAIEEIVAAVDAQVNRVVTSADFLADPTIGGLASLPGHAPTRLRDGVMLTLSSGGTASPVFLVAGAAGLGAELRELADLIGENRPVYALQARGVEWGLLPDFRIGTVSKRYLKAIRSVQPHGPYLLVGHSMGGLVAFDIAKRLRADHESVAFLALLDVADAEASATAADIARIQPSGAAAYGGSRKGAQDAGSYGAFRERILDRWPYYGRSFWRAWHEDRFSAYWKLGMAWSRRYPIMPTELGGTHVLSVAASDADMVRVDWRRYLSPEPEHVEVPGDHLTMLRPPFVRELADVVREGLARSEATVRSG